MKKWLQRIVQLVKEEKGLTLVELLAVIVILGVIAAIAVPAITGITNSTKKEAHKANAKQMIEVAKQMVAVSGFKGDVTTAWSGYRLNSSNAIDTTTAYRTQAASPATSVVMEITLDEMINANYFNGNIKNPEHETNNYSGTNNKVYVFKDGNNFLYFVEMDDVTNWSNPLLEADIDKLKL